MLAGWGEGKENEIRVPAFFPVGLLHVGTAAAKIGTDTTDMLISSHFLPLLLPLLLEVPPGMERKMASPFLRSSNLFVSAKHWQNQGSLRHVVHRFPDPCDTEEGTERLEQG